MKTILVPVEQHADATHALHLAARVALRFGSMIEGVPLRRPPALDWGTGDTIIIDDPDMDQDRIRTEARALFGSIMDAHGISEEAGDSERPGWRWSGAKIVGNELLGSYGRAFDLTCVGQPRSKGSAITTLEAALFDSGGPILIAPREQGMTVGDTILIAWNGSNETARTIAFSKPLLRRASRVVILADDGGLNHRPSGDLVRRRLERNGIASELVLLQNGRIRSGDAILDKAEAMGCDLLVKGAYTQSRIRQMIFGGATNHVLAQADMPVFMAH